jgi:hypothetical protein
LLLPAFLQLLLLALIALLAFLPLLQLLLHLLCLGRPELTFLAVLTVELFEIRLDLAVNLLEAFFQLSRGEVLLLAVAA